MKKHLAWILALVTVLAVLAACTTGSGDDTTVGDTTVTDPATNEPTNEPTDAPTEEPTEPAKSGCGSAVTFGLAAILVAAAVMVIRKKD